MFVIMKKLVRYEKYLLRYYNFINNERQNELGDIFKDLVKYNERLFYKSDKKLSSKIVVALADLSESYIKVIKVLGNILKVNNFDISLEITPDKNISFAAEADVGSDDGSNNSDDYSHGFDEFDYSKDAVDFPFDFDDDVNFIDLPLPPQHAPFQAMRDGDFLDLPLPPQHAPFKAMREMGNQPLVNEHLFHIMQAEADYNALKGHEAEKYAREEALAEKQAIYDDFKRKRAQAALKGKGMHRETPKSFVERPCIIERVNKWDYNERPFRTKYLL